MRLILTLAVFVSLASSPVFSWAQDAVPLQSKMDANLKTIIEVLVNSVVKRFPVVNQAKVTVADTSPLEQGLIQGNFDLQSGSEQNLTSSTGQVEISIKTSPTPGKVAVGVKTTGQIQTAQLIKAIETANQSICIGVSSEDCAVRPLLDGNDSVLPMGQQGTVAFNRLKENLVDYLSSYIDNAGAPKKRQSFGEASEEPEEGTGMSAEAADQLRTIIVQSLTFVVNDNGASISIDMNQVRGLGADLAAVNPGISFLVSFEKIEVTIAGDMASYNLTTTNEIPARVISTYDAFIQQEQAKPEGLNSINELVSDMGLWLIETCSASDKQAECFDKFMNTCSRDVGHVQSCVSQIWKIKAGRDAHHEGNDLAAGWNAGTGYIEGGMQKAGDGIADFFGGLFGGQQP